MSARNSKPASVVKVNWTARITTFLAIFMLSACSNVNTSSDSKRASPVYITSEQISTTLLPELDAVAGGQATDLKGNSIQVKDPSRIVSVASGAAEIVAALGLTKNLVGRDIASQSKALESVVAVTDAHALSVEKVLAQRPTLLIIDEQTSPSQSLDAIADAGVQIIEIKPAWKISEIAPRIQQIAQALGVPQQAQQLNDQIQIEIQPRTKLKVAFLYLRGTSSIYLLGGKGSGADAMIQAAGGNDVGALAGLGPFTPLTPEALSKSAPDVILVMTKGLASVGGLTGLGQLPGVAQTPAGKNKQVIAVDDGMLLAFGAETKSVIEEMKVAFSQMVAS